ncbi:MAG TPA: Flp family type IVb pilin [Alphaproteobacteria bacterium]|nr:Flp family type IVb pilin [Alphaproteobacteria bacterium]
MLIANLRNLIADESGATAIEYGLIAALVSVAAIGALTAMGNSLETMFTNVSNALDTAVTSGTTTPAP